MCLIIFSWMQHPGASLLLTANRDEFHARPSAPLGFWEDRPNVLAGRDLQAGGTWLGVSRSGRFAAVTNVRDPAAARGSAPRSRGELTTDFLAGTRAPLDYLEDVATQADQFQGFNLLLGDSRTLAYLNRDEDGVSTPRALMPGVYGISNASIDTPWPKLLAGKRELSALVSSQGAPPEHDELRRCIRDRSLADNDALEDVGLSGEMARQLSAQFIVTPDYGTRCSTTIRRLKSGELEIEERRYDQLGRTTGSDQIALPAEVRGT
ncbi:MAG: NRDE family protein [Pseudomonadota bacterium]